jgi:hypothetical protein
MKQPWIKNAWFDGAYILAPPFVALLIVLLLPERFKSTDEMPLAGWVALVLLIDGTHVYSTLYRTYLDRFRFQQHRALFLLVPITCYLTGVVLHSVNGLWFWRVLAYLAVFHFIRQQYGFMRLYSREELLSTRDALLNTVVIYAATVYPILWWHLTPGRQFNWFVDGDFFQAEANSLKSILAIGYALLLLLYFGKEIREYRRRRWLNWPRNLLILGTVVSWYVGIVWFNGDVAFTMLNVISHGIPYIALIWATDRARTATTHMDQRSVTALMTSNWAVFLGFLLVLAYLEEGLWDGFVWREHTDLFGWFQALPVVNDKRLLALVVPLLSLPQLTHYVLDGFIWRRKSHGPNRA